MGKVVIQGANSSLGQFSQVFVRRLQFYEPLFYLIESFCVRHLVVAPPFYLSHVGGAKPPNACSHCLP